MKNDQLGPEERNERLARTSRWLGILSLITCICLPVAPVLALTAVITGHIALLRARQFPEQYGDLKAAQTGRALGAFVLIMMLVGGVWFTWHSWNGTRMFDQVYNGIRPGMSVVEVEQVVRPGHRPYPGGFGGCNFLLVYQTKTNGDWISVPGDEFTQMLKQRSNQPPVNLRLHVTKYGAVPGIPAKTSFDIDLNQQGKVVKMTPPWGWD